MKLKFSLLTGCLFIGLLLMFAQTQTLPTSKEDVVSMAVLSDITTSSLNVIPPSPQARIFEKYIQHPVTEYNGLPDINIPLYNIQIGVLSIPVTLSYHASGIKYKQFDGDIGAGWSIQAGGYRVARTIYGKPDELFPYYNKTQFDDLILSGRSTAFTRDSLLTSIGKSARVAAGIFRTIGNNVKDGELDQFRYSLPSTQGEFVIADRTKKSVINASKNPDKIILDENSTNMSLNNMRIIDGQGFSYLMGYADTSKEQVRDESAGYNVNTSWLLSQIETPFNEKVTFTYKNHTIRAKRFKSALYIITDAAEYSTDSYERSNNSSYLTSHTSRQDIQYSLDDNNMKLIDIIDTPQESITFIRGNVYSCTIENTQNYCSSHVLKEIIIKCKVTGNQLRRIVFNYATSPSNAVTTNNNTPWHRILSSIEIFDRNNSRQEIYNFDYYAGPGSSTRCYADQWGYYKTGLTSNSIFSEMFIHDSFKTHRLIRSIAGSTATYITFNEEASQFPFVNRTENISQNFFFSLKKITWPTGGTTEYIYEPNQVNNTKVGGQRIRQIISKPSSTEEGITTEYLYGANEDGNGSFYALNHSPSQQFADETFSFTALRDRYGQYSSYKLGSRRATRTYGTLPFLPDADEMLHVTYPIVTSRKVNSTGKATEGKIISMYTLPNKVSLYSGNSSPRVSTYDGRFYILNYLGLGNAMVDRYRLDYTPELVSRIYYKSNGTIAKEERYEYINLQKNEYTGVKIKQKVYCDTYPGMSGNISYNEHYNHFSSLYIYNYCTTELGINNLSKQTTVLYDENGINPVTTTVSYTYDSQKRINKITENNSKGGNKITTYTYPTTGTELVTKNKISTPVQTVTENNGIEIERIKYIYGSGKIMPDYIESSVSRAANLSREVTFNEYDDRGNIRQYTWKDEVPICYIWGYNKKYPVAEVIGADLTTVRKVISETSLIALANRTQPTSTEWSTLEKLQTATELKDAHITLYKYHPLTGITEMTAPSGQKTFYTYDAFGRLTGVSIQNDNKTTKLEEYQYNLKNK